MARTWQSFNPYATGKLWELILVIQNEAKNLKNHKKNLAYGYSSENTQRELSYEYYTMTVFRWVSEIFASLCKACSRSIGRVKNTPGIISLKR